jgi:hypothetical protein
VLCWNRPNYLFLDCRNRCFALASKLRPTSQIALHSRSIWKWFWQAADSILGPVPSPEHLLQSRCEQTRKMWIKWLPFSMGKIAPNHWTASTPFIKIAPYSLRCGLPPFFHPTAWPCWWLSVSVDGKVPFPWDYRIINIPWLPFTSDNDNLPPAIKNTTPLHYLSSHQSTATMTTSLFVLTPLHFIIGGAGPGDKGIYFCTFGGDIRKTKLASFWSSLCQMNSYIHIQTRIQVRIFINVCGERYIYVDIYLTLLWLHVTHICLRIVSKR